MLLVPAGGGGEVEEGLEDHENRIAQLDAVLNLTRNILDFIVLQYVQLLISKVEYIRSSVLILININFKQHIK